MRLGRNISLGAPEGMSSINNKKQQKMRTLINTLLLCVDTLEDLTIFLDEERELHINDIIHLCNHHKWELISPNGTIVRNIR